MIHIIISARTPKMTTFTIRPCDFDRSRCTRKTAIRMNMKTAIFFHVGPDHVGTKGVQGPDISNITSRGINNLLNHPVCWIVLKCEACSIREIYLSDHIGASAQGGAIETCSGTISRHRPPFCSHRTLLSKDSRDQIQAAPGGLMPPDLPTHQCRRINAELFGHLPLRQTEPSARGGKASWDGVGRRQRVVAQESDDGRYVTYLRDGCIDFPVGNRHLMNTNLVGNLPLLGV
jgi:hypothetical protein